jgi:hypothetical protein
MRRREFIVRIGGAVSARSSHMQCKPSESHVNGEVSDRFGQRRETILTAWLSIEAVWLGLLKPSPPAPVPLWAVWTGSPSALKSMRRVYLSCR